MNFDWLLQLVLVFAPRHFVTAKSSHFGKSFIVALPKMTSKPSNIFNTPSAVFLLTTKFPDVKVTITSSWPVDRFHTLRDTVKLSAFEVYEYALNHTFNHQINVGIIYSFELSATRDFALSVALLDSVTSIATFLALPVERWGKIYFAVTLGHLITMTLIADRGPNLIIVRLKSANKNFVLTINNNELKPDQIWSFALNSNQALVISTCDSPHFVGTITGTKISGDKEFGLVTGSCYARSKSYDCKHVGEFHWGFGDIAAEMIPPYETYGRDFITFDFVKPSSGGFYFIVAADDDTWVTINEGHGKAVYTFTLPLSGSWVEKNILVSRVTSNKGILLVYAMRSPCTEKYNDTHYIPGEKGAPSLSIIVPTALFYFSYIFKIPRFVTNYNYVVVIVKRQFVRFTMLNDAAIKVERWRSVPGGQGWTYGYSRVARNINYTMKSDRSFFGCYIYGHDLMYAYMHPAGYIAGTINAPCIKNVSKMKEGDLIDNDCDGAIDEEYLNEKDDDGDNEIDEDLNNFKGVRDRSGDNTERTTESLPDHTTTIMSHPTEFQNPDNEKDVDSDDYDIIKPSVIETVDPGLVSNWLEWQCDPKCEDSRMFRERICIRPPIDADCIETLKEYREGRCNEMCHGDNADFSRWSEWSCFRNCSEARMIRTRQCQPSKPCIGNLAEWKSGSCYLTETCPDSCPKTKWGASCLQSCDNCVEDCDKFTGVCGKCLPGFLDPSKSCETTCPEFTYGDDCKQNCIAKCSEDCRDRRTGDCYDKYEPWQEWHCSKDCLDSRMYRERICKSSKSNAICLGQPTEIRQGRCYLDTICPLNLSYTHHYCDAFKWGIDCKQSCKYCEFDCNKLDGSCQSCKAGYKNPKLGCVEACGFNEYGFNCEGECHKKCGADCMEREYGHCHSGLETMALLLFLVFLFLPCVFILFRKKNRDPHMLRPKRSSYFGKIGLVFRRNPYSPEFTSKSWHEKPKKSKSKKVISKKSADDDFSLNSYEDDDDDEEDD